YSISSFSEDQSAEVYLMDLFGGGVYRFAPAGASSTLTGSVALEARGAAGDPRWIVPLSVRLFQPATNTQVMSASPTASSSGSFTVIGIPPGTYDAEVKQSQALSRRAGGVVFAAGTVTSQSFGTLLTGDVNNDNSVTIIDFSTLRASYGLSQGQPGYDARADLNANTTIDI